MSVACVCNVCLCMNLCVCVPAVENQSHCDFVKLRIMLIRTHLHDVKDISCDCHYENYRAQCIQTMTSKMNTDNRVESPIPILPLSTPDMETEKLIKMKDEELRTMQECYRRGSQAFTSLFSPNDMWEV
ncbi:septin-5-like [Coregonus clupeaformis]|uniref:septin-5-like n=1 Tax=Coregonus clupeaformis TaxID=59861 RepID=UPI001BE0F2AD|nr:septin-5-like [Coregonus clupeaformis]